MQCRIIHRYFTTLSALMEEEKKPRNYGTSHLLYHSEINLIDCVHKHPECNAITLSRMMGVTRGAVTQIGNQLEEKGFIARYLKSGNKKEKYYRLTELGDEVRRGHEQYHKEANQRICSYLSTLEESDATLIMDFLDQISMLPISEFECCGDCNCTGSSL
ncbi:MAG: MarR family transcriptional regulator [Clostridiales bacterium]|nr:MarR family transcriptional regulator [Clostridiales bacterium]